MQNTTDREIVQDCIDARAPWVIEGTMKSIPAPSFPYFA